MIGRYNPHKLATEAALYKTTLHYLPDNYLSAVKQRAEFVWNGFEYWTDLPLSNFSATRDIALEYGYDALLIASMTAGISDPSYELLESAYRWLAQVYENFIFENDENESQDLERHIEWQCTIWLAAAFTAKDHLILRNRHYAALASIKKAWKQAPPTTDTPQAGRCLIASALFPFAPTLSRHFLEQLKTWPPPSLETLSEAFPPYKPIRVALERGGWNWVTVNADKFAFHPEAELSKISWITNAFNKGHFKISKEQEGWRLCRSQQPLNAASS